MSRIGGLRCIYVFLSLFLINEETNLEKQQQKKCIHKIPLNTHKKKFWTNKTPTRKYFGLTKYPWEKKFEPTGYPREKILDPQNTYEKRFWDHELSRRKILVPQNTHERRFWSNEIHINPRWHDGRRPTRSTKMRMIRNLES